MEGDTPSLNQINMETIYIYTDGACSGNPGRGGFGTILICDKGRKEISGGFRLTTNNRMEMLAVIRALEAVTAKGESRDIAISTDSKYVSDPFILGWVEKWKRNGFDRTNGDLWRKLYALVNKHNVTFNWVKGHAGHPENEACDKLAVEAYNSERLEIDEEYESVCGSKAQFGENETTPFLVLSESFGKMNAEAIIGVLEKSGYQITKK